jgi:hypothetical protein
MHPESVYIWLTIPIVLLIIYIFSALRRKRKCVCKKYEKYTYNENQPTVGKIGSGSINALYLQPYNDFKRAPFENYNNLYYHNSKENPEYNDTFKGV